MGSFQASIFGRIQIKNSKFKLITKLRSRRQAPTESVESYFYMLDLCRQLELEQNSRMTESQKLEYLLQGLTPILLERLWPLIPEPINTTDLFLSTAVKYEQARKAADNRDWKPIKQVNLNALSKEEPGLVSCQEFEKLNAQVRDLKIQQRREKNKKQSPALYQRTHFQPNGKLGVHNRYNRTTDGRPRIPRKTSAKQRVGVKIIVTSDLRIISLSSSRIKISRNHPMPLRIGTETPTIGTSS